MRRIASFTASVSPHQMAPAVVYIQHVSVYRTISCAAMMEITMPMNAGWKNNRLTRTN